MTYQLGIDLGTTFTAAATCRDGGAPEPVRLGGVSPVVPTVVHLADDGGLLIGEAAQRRALTDSRRTVREFKRRIGDSTPLLIAGRPVAAADLAARFVVEIVEMAAAVEGGPAEHVVLTHPAEWGEHRRAELAAALAAHGLPRVSFLTEPEAAAVGYAGGLAPGDAVAVYDLGGGTFDAAVVRRTDDGFALLGSPGGLERLGGVDFDDRVFAHVRAALGPAWDALDPTDPEVLASAAALRRECTAAKEALSADTEVLVPVMLPGVHTRVRLGRAEFEDMIRPAVVESIEALRRAMDSAGVTPADLRSVLLVGGSSRIPLVSQLLSAELGRPVAVDVDPKAVVAAGAALAAQAAVTPAPAPPAEEDDEPAGAPDAPAVAFEAAPVPVAAPGRRRRTLTLVAAIGVAAVFTTSATVVTGWDTIVPGAAQAVAAAPAGTAPGSAPGAAVPIDPWTGAPPAETTVPGPRRPEAVAAVVRPVARNVPTGAAGATPSAAPPVPAAVPGAPVAPAPAPAPVPAPAPGGPAPGGPAAGGPAAGGGAEGGGPADQPADPGPVDPPVDPGPVDPGPADPPVDPGPVDPPVDPGPVDPPVDPGPVDPPVDPGPVDPPPVDPPPADPPAPVGDPSVAADPGPTP